VIALTRAVSPSIVRCELTHIGREPIDLELAYAQHARYERALADAGCTIEHVGGGEDLPDGVFVEDIAIVFDEVAIVTRPGAASRRAETPSVVRALTPHRPLAFIDAPATIDGGDVLVVGRRVFVGRSSRTNDAAVAQMRSRLEPHGYTVCTVPVHRCLHLKSAATALDDHTLLVNPAWLDGRPRPFGDLELVPVAPSEPGAANVARVGDRILCASAFPDTRRMLERRGVPLVALDMTELAKAEGAVTCCSLILM